VSRGGAGVFGCLFLIAWLRWFFVLAAIGVSGIVAFVDVVKIWNGIAK